MKTKKVLNGWVVKLLILLNFLNFTLACAEWQDLKLQILYSIFSFCFIVFILNLFSPVSKYSFS